MQVILLLVLVRPHGVKKNCPRKTVLPHQGLGLGGGKGGKVVGVSEEELVKLQEDADRREKQLKQQVHFWLSPPPHSSRLHHPSIGVSWLTRLTRTLFSMPPCLVQ